MSTATNASPFAIAPFADRPLQRGLEFGASLRWPALTASVLLIGTVGATLAQPVLVSWVIDRGVLPKDMDALSLSVVQLLAAVAAEAVLTAGHLLLFAWVGEQYLALLRNQVFEHLSQLSLRFYDAHSTGALIARASDDVQTLSTFVRSGLSRLLTGVLLLGLGIVVMGSLSPPLLAVSLISVPMLRWLSRRYLRRAEPAQRSNRERYAASLDVIEQGLTGAGAGLNSVGMVSVGVVSAFVLSLTRIFGPLESLGGLFGDAQSAKASLGRIFALLDVPLEIQERTGAVALSSGGNLEASIVSFSYLPGIPVLREIDLSVQPGETLALVGAYRRGQVHFGPPAGQVVRFRTGDDIVRRAGSQRRQPGQRPKPHRTAAAGGPSFPRQCG